MGASSCMNHKTAFIGHRNTPMKIFNRLKQEIINQIKNNCLYFSMGTRGTFDSLALTICKELKNTYANLKIEIVLTNLNILKYYSYKSFPFNDVSTIFYDIETIHPKRQITYSNQKMIDSCDTLICYVDVTKRHSGAKTAMNYALKKGIKIINLYKPEDEITYGMSKGEKEKFWQEWEKQIDNLSHK